MGGIGGWVGFLDSHEIGLSPLPVIVNSQERLKVRGYRLQNIGDDCDASCGHY